MTMIEDSSYVVLSGDEEEKEPTFLDKYRALNRNVKFILVIVAFAGLSESMGFGAALSAYLYLSTGKSNIRIGFLESCMGVTKLVTALPMGDFSDKYGREPIGKIGSFAYVAATTVTVYAILERASLHTSGADSQTLFIIWAVALCIWGFGKGVVDGPVLALFADSVPTGDRSLFYYYLYVAFWFGALAGPTAAIVIFSSQKNDWTFTELATVICVALVFKIFNAVLLCFLRDKDSLGLEAQHVEAMGETSSSSSSSSVTTEKKNLSSSPQKNGSSPMKYKTLNLSENNDDTSDTGSDRGSSFNSYEDIRKSISEKAAARRNALIPRLVFAASLVTQLGAGMTVKFYPLFFMEDVGMTPAAVQGVYLGVPLSMLVCGSLATRLAGSGFGRVQTIVLFKTLGVIGLIIFIIVEKLKHLHGMNHTILCLLYVPPFLAATAFTDSTFPLEESILMDFVPTERRGRWKSLESVSQFGWCGSAIFGGYLADRFDYSYTFSITAVIQASAILIWIALISLVPKEEQRAPTADLNENVEDNKKHSTEKVINDNFGLKVETDGNNSSHENLHSSLQSPNHHSRHRSNSDENESFFEVGRTSSVTSPLSSF